MNSVPHITIFGLTVAIAAGLVAATLFARVKRDAAPAVALLPVAVLLYNLRLAGCLMLTYLGWYA